MILGCIIPLILLFFAPAFGINDSISFFIFIIAMFGFHLLVPMHNHNSINKKTKKDGKN